jgi:hypothetical protein
MTTRLVAAALFAATLAVPALAQESRPSPEVFRLALTLMQDGKVIARPTMKMASGEKGILTISGVAALSLTPSRTDQGRVRVEVTREGASDGPAVMTFDEADRGVVETAGPVPVRIEIALAQ